MPTRRFPPVLPLALTATLLPGPVLAQFDETSVLASARAGYGGGCTELEEPKLPEWAVRRFEVMVPAGDGMDPQPAILWQTLCQWGGSNRSFAFWVEDDFGGLQPLAFVRPVVEEVLERPDDPASPVSEVKVTGWTSTTLLLNVEFDPAKGTFSHKSLARGLGDAFEAGTWRLGIDQTVLQTFEVDASYDGEINPLKVYPTP